MENEAFHSNREYVFLSALHKLSFDTWSQPKNEYVFGFSVKTHMNRSYQIGSDKEKIGLVGHKTEA